MQREPTTVWTPEAVSDHYWMAEMQSFATGWTWPI
jgi:hypothetical protein